MIHQCVVDLPAHHQDIIDKLFVVLTFGPGQGLVGGLQCLVRMTKGIEYTGFGQQHAMV